MSEHTLSENLIRLQEAKEDIADAIVEMGGTASSATGLESMPDAIRTIKANPTLITKSITSNGAYNAEDDNADGYSSVTVAVPDSGAVKNLTIEYTSNSQFIVREYSGNGISCVQSGAIVLISGYFEIAAYSSYVTMVPADTTLVTMSGANLQTNKTKYAYLTCTSSDGFNNFYLEASSNGVMLKNSETLTAYRNSNWYEIHAWLYYA